MSDVVQLLWPQLFALGAGALAVYPAFRGVRHAWCGTMGYGYLVGLTLGAIALYVMGMTGVGVRFFPAAALQFVLAVVMALAVRTFARGARAEGEPAEVTSRGAARLLIALFAAVLVARAVSLGMEATLVPLYPWDAWQQWGTKARVWFDTRELRPFVTPEAWLQLSPGNPAGVYTDANPAYPPLVPLMQVWTLGATGTWNDAILGLTWIGLYCAFGFAFAHQSYRILPNWAFALGATYVVLSLPLLDTHVALAGYADLPISVLYCLALMSAVSWERFGRRGDAAMAIALIAILPFFKRPGIAWALTFLPFLSCLLPASRRGGYLRALVIAAALGGLAVTAIHLPGHGADALDALWSVAVNLFAWENWHLLWYVAGAVLVLQRRRLRDGTLGSAAAMLALGAIFLATVFWGTDLSASIANVTTLNRALLPFACVTCYFLALLVAPDVRQLVTGAPADVPIRAPAGD